MIKLEFVPKRLRLDGHKVGDVVHLDVAQEAAFVNKCWGYTTTTTESLTTKPAKKKRRRKKKT